MMDYQPNGMENTWWFFFFFFSMRSRVKEKKNYAASSSCKCKPFSEGSTLRCTSTIDPFSCFWLLAATRKELLAAAASLFFLECCFILRVDCSFFFGVQVLFSATPVLCALCACVKELERSVLSLTDRARSLLGAAPPVRSSTSRRFVVLDFVFFFSFFLSFSFCRPKKWLH